MELSSNDPLKDTAEGRSLAVLVAMLSHSSLYRNAPPTRDVHTLVVYGDRHSNTFDRNFSSLIVRAWSDKERSPGNGAGDRSQTSSKVSSNLLLLNYSAIMIFAKMVIWQIRSQMHSCSTRTE